MPERCDICGVAALESQTFVVERIPFRKASLYCPACHRRLYLRVYAILGIFILGMGCWGVIAARHDQTRLLDSVGVWVAVLCVFQWLLILPHELGHALVARLCGLAQIRILVGAGKPIFSFNFLGFPMLINRIPFGGITLFKHVGAPNRWKHLLVVAAGPLVNTVAAAAVWPFLPDWRFFGGSWTISKLFVAANLVVVIENLLPRSVQTPFGMVRTDGLQLWICLFRWNRQLRTDQRTSSSGSVRMHQLLKWASFSVLAIATLFFLLFTAMPWIPTDTELSLHGRIVITAIMLPLALLAGSAAIWTARSSVSRFGKTTPGGDLSMGAFSFSPDQQPSLREAIKCAGRKDFTQAEAIVDQTLASIPNASPAYAQLLRFKLRFILASTDIDRAEKLCLEFANPTAATSEQKLIILDTFVSWILARASSPYLENAERVARLALEIAPGTLTLKGSLGAVLAERGKFAEAEPLLLDCLDRSPALPDQGICAYYLGIVKAAAGKQKEARTLIKRSIVLYAEPWLVAKAEAKLKDLEKGT